MPRGIPNTQREAKHNPAIVSKALEAADKPLGHTVRDGDPNADTPAGRIGETKLVQVADSIDQEWAANMAFMNEPVTIRIDTTSDKEAEQVFELTVNGRTEFFRRGEVKTLPRYYVDLMCRLKITRYNSVETLNAKGDRCIVQEPFTALKYGFSVLKDANPLGEAWLTATLAMPG